MSTIIAPDDQSDHGEDLVADDRAESDTERGRGVGVAPFLSWLRALDGRLPQRVDFFYSAVGEPPFADEIRAIAGRHASLRVP